MARLRRAEVASTLHRDAFVASVRHSIDFFEANFRNLPGRQQYIDHLRRRVDDALAGRPVVDRGTRFGVPRAGGRLFVLEPDASITRVRDARQVNGMHDYERPDGSLVFTSKKTRTERSR